MIQCLKNEDLSMIPMLFETDDLGIKDKEKIIHLHLYNDMSHWFIIEFDGEKTFYGIVIQDVDKDKSEWRNIPLIDLQSPGQNSAAIKCDQNWNPVKAESVELIKTTNNWD